MAKQEIVYVNEDKRKRAEEIVGFLNGKPTKDDGEEERKQRFAAIMASEKIDSKSEGAVQFVYEKLGGLIRTVHEQEKFEAKVEQMKSAKKPVEGSKM